MLPAGAVASSRAESAPDTPAAAEGGEQLRKDERPPQSRRPQKGSGDRARKKHGPGKVGEPYEPFGLVL